MRATRPGPTTFASAQTFLTSCKNLSYTRVNVRRGDCDGRLGQTSGDAQGWSSNLRPQRGATTSQRGRLTLRPRDRCGRMQGTPTSHPIFARKRTPSPWVVRDCRQRSRGRCVRAPTRSRARWHSHGKAARGRSRSRSSTCAGAWFAACDRRSTGSRARGSGVARPRLDGARLRVCTSCERVAAARRPCGA